MATTTPNYGWPVPTSSDLVKNGATAIEALGDAIDASLLDLKGGTTGQVLKKNTNTDMDFVWSADSAGMTNPMTTTGDTIYSSSGSTPARLGIGSTGQVLTVASGVPSWATPAGGGGKVLQVVTATDSTAQTIATTTMTDIGLTASITPSSATSKILVLCTVFAQATRTYQYAGFRINLTRGGTQILRTWANGSDSISETGLSGDSFVNDAVTMTYLDSPATTSSTTYRPQLGLNTTANSQAVDVLANVTQSIILMEIGA